MPALGKVQENGYLVGYADKIIGITGTGTKRTFAFERPLSKWSLQVYGIGAAATAWNVRLKAGLDSDKVGTLIEHNSAGTPADADGDVKYRDGAPITYIEVEVVSLTLGSATSIQVAVIGGV